MAAREPILARDISKMVGPAAGLALIMTIVTILPLAGPHYAHRLIVLTNCLRLFVAAWHSNRLRRINP